MYQRQVWADRWARTNPEQGSVENAVRMCVLECVLRKSMLMSRQSCASQFPRTLDAQLIRGMYACMYAFMYVCMYACMYYDTHMYVRLVCKIDVLHEKEFTLVARGTTRRSRLQRMEKFSSQRPAHNQRWDTSPKTSLDTTSCGDTAR